MRLFAFLAGMVLSPLCMAEPDWQFDVTLGTGPAILDVRACRTSAAERVEFRAARAAEGVLLSQRRSSGRPLEAGTGRRTARNWEAGECLHSRIDLVAAAATDRYRLGGRVDGYWRIDPRHWLWRPARLDPDTRLQVRLPAGWSASLPWKPLAGGAYRLGATPWDWPASSVFGRFVERRIVRPGGVLRLAVVPVVADPPEAALRGWIESVADDLLHSHGRLPVPDVQLLVLPLPGVRGAVPWGQVTRGGGTAIHLFPGLEAGRERWRADWTATHELAHLLHPYLGERGRWLGEGLASYYQNVLRARSGELSPEAAWAKLQAGFERGRRATEGHDDSLEKVAQTRLRGSTMRVYWAGAAFWMEADIALRQQGSSLDAVLEAFARRHLPAERRWTPEQFAAALDEISPQGEWRDRLRRFADSTRFPAVDVRVLALAAGEADAAPAWMRAIMQPGSRDLATR